MANTNRLETADRPPAARDTSSEVSHVARETAAQPGEGAAKFQQSATDSQNLVKAGTLPDTVISFEPKADSPRTPGDNASKEPGKSETRQDQIDQLRKVVGDFDLASGIKPENRDAVLGSAVDTANKIAGLPAGSAGRKETFTEAVKDFQKDNPGVDASTFTRQMQTVFNEMGSKTLSTRFSSNSVMLSDSSQRSDTNPSGIVASVFSGDSSPESQKAEKAFDTAQTLAESGKQVDFNGEVMRELQFSNFLAGVKDLEPRERPSNPQSTEEQIERLKQGFSNKPEALFQDVLKQADNLAFNTKGGELGNRFNETIDDLAKNNPSIPKELLGRMMVEGLRTVTQSKDFALGTVSSSVEMSFLQDKRLATEANPRGTASVALIGADDLPTATQDFKSALETAKVLQQGIGKLGERATKDDVNRFLIDVRNDFGNLRSELF